ncbi:MAG: hypothetical protein M1820_010858 [Bogoriella megaspora]|nr:MAG: hypothetical protein M1820_010858 [Bogoriella megaspora]
MSNSKPQITLYRGWDTPTQYVWSPFVTKLELRLRLGDISYQTAAGNARVAPTGKIPYVGIRDGEVLTKIGDSALIAEHFIEDGILGTLGDDLGPVKKAEDVALRALVEDRLYFFNMRERWLDNPYIQRDHVLGSFSPLLRFLISSMIYRQHTKTLYGQGVGRFSADEARQFREEIWRTINNLLEQRRREAAVKEVKECFWCLGGD